MGILEQLEFNPQEETPAHGHALRALQAEFREEYPGMTFELFKEETGPEDELTKLIFKGIHGEEDPFKPTRLFRVIPEEKGGWRVEKVPPKEAYGLLAGE